MTEQPTSERRARHGRAVLVFAIVLVLLAAIAASTIRSQREDDASSPARSSGSSSRPAADTTERAVLLQLPATAVEPPDGWTRSAELSTAGDMVLVRGSHSARYTLARYEGTGPRSAASLEQLLSEAMTTMDVEFEQAGLEMTVTDTVVAPSRTRSSATGEFRLAGDMERRGRVEMSFDLEHDRVLTTLLLEDATDPLPDFDDAFAELSATGRTDLLDPRSATSDFAPVKP